MKHKYFLFSVLFFLFCSPVFLNAQSVSNTQATIHKPDIEAFNDYLKTFHVLKSVMEKTGASLDQMKVFCRYYKDTIMGRDKQNFVKAVQNRQIVTQDDIKQYAEKTIAHYVNMYNKFADFTKEFPETVHDYLSPRRPPPPSLVCNPACDNIDFEQGSLTAWTACYAANAATSSSFATTTPTCFGPLGAVTVAAYDPSTSSNQVSLTSGAGLDPIAGALIPVVCPTGGSYSSEVGDGTGINYGVAILEQSWMVTQATANLTYMYAVVLENPNHTYYQQPYFKIDLLDQNGNPIPGCGQYYVVSGPGLPGYTAIYYTPDADTVYCLPWQTSFVPLQNYIGTCVTIIVTSSDCGAGAHFGYGYFDATCSPLGIITSSPAICGSNNITLTGPNGAASYVWSGPCIVGSSTSQTITVSCAGTYSVIVTSNIRNACNDTLSITITNSPVLNFNLVSTTNILCNGGNTGSATVLASGGTSPYTYSWAPVSGSNASISGLSAGTYTSYVRDAAGCLDSVVFTITQPPPLTATTTTTPTACSANSGSATVTAGGGVSPYIYSWSAPGGSSANETGLSAGTYTITVTDANGCTQSATAVVTSGGGLSLTTSTTGVLCNGGNTGSASVVVAGGTSPFTYSWSPVPGTNATLSGLSAGTYTINVVDANGCAGVATAVVTQPPALTATTTTTPTSCGGNSGTATVTPGGGTSPYTYSWSSGGGSNTTASGLSAGTYTIYLTDANGCTQSATATVLNGGGLTVSTTVVNELCSGASTGSATVMITGGTSPFTYSWSPISSSNATASGLSAGTYTINVSDANGCTGVDSVVITQPPALTASTSSTQTTCGGNSGTTTVIAGGGTPNYSYLWNPSLSTLSTATGLSAGNYTVTITDANGCTLTASASVSSIGGGTLTTTSTNILCFGANNGSATATMSSGTSPFTYSWSPSGGSNSTASGLSAGIYTITVTDANGCVSIANVTITQPALLKDSITSVVNLKCNGVNTGSISTVVSGGTSPYIFLWTPSGGNTANATGLSAGSYSLNVTDANGCTASITANITQPTALSATTTSINIGCSSTTGSVAVVVSGGTPVYTYLWTPSNSSNSIVSGLTAGTYSITITDANGCTLTNSATITAMPAVSVSITASANIKCNGDNNGSATCSASGGTSPYTYQWSPSGGTNTSASGLSAGTYTITVTDANNCTVTATVNISEPAVLVVSASAPASVCNGAPALLSASTSGGTTPYIFSWSSSGATTDTSTVYPLTNTTYTIFVTDANGCTASAVVSVMVDLPLSISIAGDTTACPGQPIYLFVSGSGGDGTYNYKWVPSNSSTQWVSFTLNNDTTVVVELTDGCGTTMLTRTINVLVAPLPQIAYNINPTIGCYPLCIQFRDLSVISSGTINSWRWKFGDGDSSSVEDPIYCYNDTGTFTVGLTVTSALGCSSTLNKLDLIQVYPHPIANFTYSPNPINVLSPNVQFTDESTPNPQGGGSGVPISEWFWKLGDGTGITFDRNPSHVYSDTGVFCVSLQIMDEHGCTDSVTKCLDVEPLYTFYIPNAFTPNGDDINDIFQPKGTYIKSYEMFIFDRWGMKLYHSTDFATGWNGRMNNAGDICQEDTYIYLIYVSDSEGNKHTYTGKVNLIR